MLNSRSVLSAALLVAVVGVSVPASAYEQGDWIIRAGAAMVDPDTDSDPIDIGDTRLPGGVDIDDDTQFGITGTYMLTNTWGIELLASSPFEHDINLVDAPVAAGSAKQLPPTLTVMWYPRGNIQGFQPYIGLGVNYTYFWDEEVDKELETALGEIVGTPGPLDADLDLDDSFSWAGHAGFDYTFNDRWGLNASVWYLDIDTEADISTELGSVKFDVDVDPWVYMVGVSYRF
jgi:outer membrane protein